MSRDGGIKLFFFVLQAQSLHSLHKLEVLISKFQHAFQVQTEAVRADKQPYTYRSKSLKGKQEPVAVRLLVNRTLVQPLNLN